MEAQIDNEMVYSALLFLSHKVFLILFSGFVLITVLLLTWSLIFIHRIVGPIFRLERELDNLIEGKKFTKIRFRKYDSFASLAEKINVLFDKLQNNK
jgi:signal transduction histidine kinase